jgi:glycosyltransferase involved in cell wall biosynthesis
MSFDLIYFEPRSGGYHTGFCKIFLARAVDDARVKSIHFVVGKNFSTYAGADPLDLYGRSPKVSVEYLSDKFVDSLTLESISRVRRGIALWKEGRRLLTARPGSICFINLLDTVLFGAVLDRAWMPGVITGIVMHPPFKLAIRKAPLASLRRWLVRSAQYYFANYKTMPIVFTFDEYYLNDLPHFISRHWQFVPDPVPLPRQMLSSAFLVQPASAQPLRTRFLMFGSLGRRKGVLTLLEALQKLDQNDLERMDIVLAGEFREDPPAERLRLIRLVESATQLKGLVLKHINRYFSDEELVQQLNACHVVLAPYVDHIGVSEVILWAAAAGKPVLTQDTGWIGHVVREANLGLTCDTSSPNALAKAMIQASQPATYAHFDLAKLRAFSFGHSSDDFYEAIVSRLAELSANHSCPRL